MRASGSRGGIGRSPAPFLLGALLLLLSSSAALAAKTNYEQQGISITYEEEEGVLPSFGTLNGTVTELDTIKPTIALNKTEAFLKCDSGDMNVQLKFKQPFYGIVYADYDRNSACKISGNGKLEETILLPLKGCGTLQSPARVFTNNIVVRFHPGLEIDGDEVITILCRYPPPIVPPPAIPAPLQVAPSDPIRTLQPLRELEILMIICAIIFLGLLLMGIGCSYYCLKKRNIKVVRRRPTSTLGSDITKVSEPVSLFDGLKIPRAHAVDASGSEEVTESIRTDFASDIASVVSEEEYTSAYSDKMCVLAEGAVVSKLTDPPMPNFDMRVKVRNKEIAYTPAMSTASSDSELVLNAQEQYLTTILERTETNTKETLERIRAAKAKRGPPPVHARINVKNKQLSDTSDVESVSEVSRDGTEQFSEQEMELESRNLRGMTIDAQHDRSQGFDVKIKHRRNEQDFHQASGAGAVTSDSEYSVQDYSGHHQRRDEQYHQEHVSRNDYTTTHTTTEEHHVTSSAHNHQRDTTNATVHHHDMSLGSELITPVILRRGADGADGSNSNNVTTNVTRTTAHHTVQQHQDAGGAGRPLSNFDVLIRIVDEPRTASEVAQQQHDRDDLSSVFTEDERTAIRQVLLQDQGVQNEMKSTFFRQDFLTLRNNELIKERVEPQKWDVLIRVLSVPDGAAALSARDNSSLTSQSFVGEEQEIIARSGLDMVGSGGHHSYAASEGVSTFVSQGGRSAADRSAAEITEYHHYQASTSTATAAAATAAQQSFGWFEDDEKRQK